MNGINIWAALLAGVLGLFFGGLWYSAALFGGKWNRENGGHPHEMKGRHPALTYGISIALSIVAAVAFAWWLGPAPSLDHSLKSALLVAAAFVATSFGINYQFAGRSNTLWAIDAGYHIMQFLIFGLVLGLWH